MATTPIEGRQSSGVAAIAAKDARVAWLNGQSLAVVDADGSLSGQAVRVNHVSWLHIAAPFTAIAPGRYEARCRLRLLPDCATDELYITAAAAPGCGTATSQSYSLEELQALQGLQLGRPPLHHGSSGGGGSGGGRSGSGSGSGSGGWQSVIRRASSSLAASLVSAWAEISAGPVEVTAACEVQVKVFATSGAEKRGLLFDQLSLVLVEEECQAGLGSETEVDGHAAEEVRAKLAGGMDPDYTDAEGFTSLHAMAAAGLPRAIGVLLSAGAKPDGPLVDQQHPTPLFFAVRSGSEEAVRTLLAGGACPDGGTWAGQDADSMTPLHEACEAGQLEIVRLLLEAGARPDGPCIGEVSITPLQLAVLKLRSDAQAEVVRQLVAAGADMKRPLDGGLCGLGWAGTVTLLHVAAARGNLDGLAALLEAGADPSPQAAATLVTPLHEAARAANAAAAQALLSAGASVGAVDKYGSTPLHWVVQYWELGRSAEYLGVAQVLLEAKGDPQAADKARATPLSLARRWGIAQLESLLGAAVGATPPEPGVGMSSCTFFPAGKASSRLGRQWTPRGMEIFQECSMSDVPRGRYMAYCRLQLRPDLQLNELNLTMKPNKDQGQGASHCYNKTQLLQLRATAEHTSPWLEVCAGPAAITQLCRVKLKLHAPVVGQPESAGGGRPWRSIKMRLVRVGAMEAPGEGNVAVAATSAAGMDVPDGAADTVLGRPFSDLEADFKLGRVLGCGTFGTTRIAVSKGDGKRYACKSIPKAQLRFVEDMEDVRREIEIMHLLKGHPNITYLRGTYEDRQAVHLVMDLCSGGELYESIAAKGSYSERDAAALVRKIVGTVAHCHSLGVMHRDLKPENFLLEEPHPDTELKCADFGLSAYFRPGQRLHELTGSPFYIAPEVLRRNYGHEADIWSCGVILYVLLSGRMPFYGKSDREIFSAVQKGKFDMDVEPWPDISAEAKDCIRRMLRMDPKERASAEEILKHAWMKEHGVASDRPLDNVILTRISHFARMNKMKQEAMKIIAGSMPAEEIAGLLAIFKAIDEDGNGTITAAELKSALDSKAPLMKKEDLEMLIQMLDADAGGTLGYREFLAATLSVHQIMKEEHLVRAFRHFDKDGSGTISREELWEALKCDAYGGGCSECEIDTIISQIDSNDDGLVDYNEFCEMMLRRDEAALLVVQHTERLTES